LVDSSVPVKVPDGAAGAVDFVGVGVGAFVVGAAGGGAVFVAVVAGVLAGADGVVGVVTAGAVGDDDAFGAVFVAVLDGDALGEEDAAGVRGGADTDSPAGVLGKATGVTPGTWVLKENSAARPATVPPRVRTARRIQPPVGEVAPGGNWRLEVEGLVVDAAPGDACGDE
jgi:hypothetical protein